MKPGLKLNVDEGSTSAETLPERVARFRSDPDKMAVATKFVDELIVRARAEADKRQDSSKAAPQTRRMSEVKSAQKVVTRARGVVVRWFENICNCTHTAIGRRTFFNKSRSNSAAAAAPTQN